MKAMVSLMTSGLLRSAALAFSNVAASGRQRPEPRASERYGEEVMAWVRARPDSVLTNEVLSQFCKGRIASYKIPSYWRFVESFPMTVTGKIQKFRMREMAIAELHLERAASVATA